MKKTLFTGGWRFAAAGEPLRPVILPHDAMLHRPRDPAAPSGSAGAYFPGGRYVYEKSFTLDAEAVSRHTLFYFEGVYKNARVLINGAAAGQNAYGYLPFSVPADGLLREGENCIRVECDNVDQPDSRWYSGAGIYLPVWMLTGPSASLEPGSVRVTTTSVDPPAVRVETAVSEGEVSVEILDGEQVIAAAEGADVAIPLPGAGLWSEESPKLYAARVTRRMGEETDTETVSFGIRTIAYSPQGFFVNGRRTLLRGGCVHHDNGILGAATFDESVWRRVRMLKEAGFNAIRSAHHPASRALLNACDELGVYVMDEAFDVWQVGKSTDDYAKDFDLNWRADVRAMVEKDFNHPSVILYSIGNEIQDLAVEAGVELAKRIANEVKELDGTRFTTSAISGVMEMMYLMANASIVGEKIEAQKQEEERRKDVNETMADSESLMRRINNQPWMDKAILGGCEAVDIAGYNYMHSRYEPDIEKYPDRVIVGSETYAKYIDEMWAHMKTHNNVIGDFTWTGWDYLGETAIGGVRYDADDRKAGFYGRYPYLTANCGDIDITGFRMPQSYYREIVFGLRKEPFLCVHEPSMAGKQEILSPWSWGASYESWSFPGYEGTPLTVDVYAKGEAEIFLNGRSLGKVDCGEHCRGSITVPYEAGVLEAVTKEDGKVYRFALRTAGEERRLSLHAEPSFDGQLIFLDVAITDGSTVHFLGDVPVTLNVEGGTLLGFGSGAYSTEESFTDNIHTTYHGRAFAVILAEKEEVHITARAEGLDEETIVVVK